MSAPDTSAFSKTILHLMQCTNLGGMEQTTYRTMQELQNRGWTFKIVTPRPFGPGEERVRQFDPDARSFPYQGRFGWKSRRPFASYVRELSQECSHIWVTGTCAACLASVRTLEKPKLLGHHFHHFESASSGFKWKMFYSLLCRSLDTITYPTRFTRDEALRIAPWLKAKARVVYYGGDVFYEGEAQRLKLQAQARQTLNLPHDAWIVGNAGWLIARKRWDIFLHTAAIVKKLIPQAYFVLCGGGPLENELRQMADDLGLGQSVRFTGWVQDLEPFYQAFDVFLFNSDFDTLPCAPTEAASHGCNVVSSLLYGGLSEQIIHNENGFLLSEHDTDHLARLIGQLHQDPALALRLRESFAAKLKREFSLKTNGDFYDHIFQSHSAR